MYTAEEKSTAIAYRLINENLPKFIDNLDIFAKISASAIYEKMDDIYRNFEDILNVKSINELFRLGYYSVLLTQAQIDVYNAIIGGKNTSDGRKIQGINEYINLFNQQQADKANRLPKLKPLFKQILSDRNAISWLSEEFAKDEDMLERIERCYQDLKENVFNKNAEGGHSLKTLLVSLKDYDLNKIYIRNDLQLTDISQKMFGNWGIIQKAIERDFEDTYPQKPKESNDKYEERKKKYSKSLDSISIGYIDSCLKKLGEPYDQKVEDYFQNLDAIDNPDTQKENIFQQIENQYTNVKDLLNTPYPENKNLSQDKKNVEKIKSLLDCLKELQRFVRPLFGKGDEAEKDEKFYSELSTMWERLNGVTVLYNKVRNRMTRKPYSTEKIKLNFDNSTLLDGWDVNKESDNTGLILRKEDKFYLGIMNKKYNRSFDIKEIKTEGPCYDKMEYKLLPGANKMLPKVFFSQSRIEEFNPSDYIIDIKDKGSYKKGDNFNINDCHALIDFFKLSINKHQDWKNFDFHFSDTSSYDDISGFYREVEQQGYKITFRRISESYINELVDTGKLFLFQIYNKDFSPYSKGTPNMHTLYWKMLFDERNLKDVIYKLNGQAEVFFRKSSIKCDKPTHPADIPIENKNPENKKMQSTFKYDLIKDRRYTVDKFEFHVPITMNFKSKGTDNINLLVNEYLKHSDATHIIGIDRGERHLLYLSLIDMQGNVIKQYTLNEIINEYNGNLYCTDYHALLDKKEGEREKARKSWQTIENIKELKEGYLSQVVHKISQLVVEYNAIVVLEDLNIGFMRGRQKVEKQVYQKFEEMLIDKFNYLVDKKESFDNPCGLLHALQLTSKFDSFQKLGKQSGILFYIPAWNTSKMDPVTGFVNLFDTRYESIDKSKLFFSKFDSISYNSTKDWFEFAFDYNKFTTKAEGSRTKWTICSYSSRIETFRNEKKNNEWDCREVLLTSSFKDLFNLYNIDITGNLKEAISSIGEKDFFERLLHLFKLTVQMRNSRIQSEIDYLISPVHDNNGRFFDSRACDDKLPTNADANGAYNIARKGLWAIEQIKKCEDFKRLKLAISNKDWLKFAQEKPYLNKK
jgi:CRISPR-associated protein Cpf1